MASSKLKNSLYDPYRQLWVAATPEEIVRQTLLHVMTEALGYPRHLLAVEVHLSELPDLRGMAPSRRADILCYHDVGGKLKPLLLIECKEGRPGNKAKRQVLGYNHFVSAPFVAVAGPKYVALVHPQELSFLPSYEQLKEHACS